jgi:ABC-type branched-subunit amino acid transport system substrate-binding protein
VRDAISGATRRAAVGLLLGAPLLGACAGVQSTLTNAFGTGPAAPSGPPAGPAQQPQAIGTGGTKVGLILPLSASGNAGVAAQSMKNAAEMALAEFQNPSIQLLIKDDNGSAQGAQQAAQQALDEGSEIILGPLFALSVPATAQLTRARNVPVIAFSTDSSVAGRGVYLLSFLPESDVNRIVDYAAGTGKRSFAAMLPENAYGNVVEVAFKQAVARKGGRIVAFERYGADRSSAARNIAASLTGADALFIADDGDAVVATADALDRGGRQSAQCAIARYGPVGQSARVQQCGAAGRSLCRAGSGRVSCFRRSLPREIWQRSRAHRDARLRCGRTGRRFGAHPGRTALRA